MRKFLFLFSFIIILMPIITVYSQSRLMGLLWSSPILQGKDVTESVLTESMDSEAQASRQRKDFENGEISRLKEETEYEIKTRYGSLSSKLKKRVNVLEGRLANCISRLDPESRRIYFTRIER